MSLDPFVTIAIMLAAALVGGMVAHRLRQPIILGYLIIGVAVGPYALGLVGDLELIEAAATIGVALLKSAMQPRRFFSSAAKLHIPSRRQFFVKGH